MVYAPMTLLIGVAVAGLAPAPPIGHVFVCAFAQVHADADGKISSREVSETIRVGAGVLQAWSEKDAAWLPNQCAGSVCEFTADGFRFETVQTTKTDDFTSVLSARMKIDAKTGRVDAETRFATTLAHSGYLTEANTHNAGACHSAPDPAGP